ncbi:MULTISPECIES: bifunctional riboflavin kinase/FAD synthetase [Alteromonadaceae]|uniref:bifunctional riboflavin kinase/FAD synthetase n=1 Tax=Alteromonadaceae TaxID=72275 RepID=UPI001C0A50C3|nr:MULTISPECIES: bifunctional riboflavin kinase/FAD synthetase [unclassified Aliiglaciecola]MBU2879703.1 bifunctional riboflavin kinase/FAD synthetase [Aliiglaciecola lipolytica]MDO6710018.1 bifunctional riboflavin kinase/FAD synthetase [Aliiglaciecola sp. 2_MG-2023]MDO6751166.1 bifunctional riboflavin kinase/FAD synthetase [Aliiglaciecola sp. 1_MG-2023]
MELIRGLHNIREDHKGCVLTIGKFDGVHLGHQAVLRNLVLQAKNLGLPSTVMVFEPQPEEVFTPEDAPARLSRLRDKFEQLRLVGVDRLLCIKFDREFASQTANYFIKHLLVEKLGIEFLVVGDDFRFGKGRQGDFTLLEQNADKYGYKVVSTRSFLRKDCRISSTEIRTALANGDISEAEAMLGRPFAIAGKVVHGEKRGRTIGFPTANVLLKRCQTPIQGVFAVKVRLDGAYLNGVANVGIRPTVNGQRSQLEVHMFDFNKQIYGQLIQVEFIKKLRDEIKFESFELLKKQIEFDAQIARELLCAD